MLPSSTTEGKTAPDVEPPITMRKSVKLDPSSPDSFLEKQEEVQASRIHEDVAKQLK